MFVKMKVVKQLFTDVYAEVPDGFDIGKLMHTCNASEIGRIADDTTDCMDWDDTDWQDDVEVNSVEIVTEKEANEYAFGVLNVEAVK